MSNVAERVLDKLHLRRHSTEVKCDSSDAKVKIKEHDVDPVDPPAADAGGTKVSLHSLLSGATARCHRPSTRFSHAVHSETQKASIVIHVYDAPPHLHGMWDDKVHHPACKSWTSSCWLHSYRDSSDQHKERVVMQATGAYKMSAHMGDMLHHLLISGNAWPSLLKVLGTSAARVSVYSGEGQGQGPSYRQEY